jgi:hypothetical protein
MTPPRKTTVELSVSTMRALAAFRREADLLNGSTELLSYTLAARIARDVDAQAKRDAKAATEAPKVCAGCSAPIGSPWSRARYCSPRCAQRARKGEASGQTHGVRSARARSLWSLGFSYQEIAREVGWGTRVDLVRAAIGGGS